MYPFSREGAPGSRVTIHGALAVLEAALEELPGILGLGHFTWK